MKRMKIKATIKDRGRQVSCTELQHAQSAQVRCALQPYLVSPSDKLPVRVCASHAWSICH
jgi:hypothetical protein